VTPQGVMLLSTSSNEWLSILKEEIHIWRIPVAAEDSLPQRLEALSPSEQARARSFQVQDARASFVTCRWALRQLLGTALGLAPGSLRFDFGSAGKPELEDAPAKLFFNVSHSGAHGLIALSSADRVGVDIEEIRAIPEMKELSRRFFTPAESEAIHCQSRSNQTRAFFACWTRKEALLKGLGVGIAGGLDRFEVGVDPDAWTVELCHETLCAGSWRLRSFAFDEYIAAVAVAGKSSQRIRMMEWPSNEWPHSEVGGFDHAFAMGTLRNI
jgi:4'-phosphopantetheinyl transferase